MKVLRPVFLMAMSIFIAGGLFISSTAVADPPENASGAIIVRTEFSWWAAFRDNGMAAFVGADIHAFCTESPPFVDIWDVMEITNPSDIGVFMEKFKGDDVATFVYPETAVFTPDFDLDHLCEYHFDYGEIASGTSDAIYHDNDWDAYAHFHNRMNSFGLSATGTLFTQSGDPVAFSGGYQCIFRPNPDPDKERYKCNERINLNN